MRFTDDYRNSAYIPGGDNFLPRWQAAAADYRAGAGARARLGLRHAADERGWFDLFLPDAASPAGLLVFIHGGYWMEGSPRLYSHLAAGAVARGWAVAMPAYPLAPGARIAAITAAIAAALPVMAAELPEGRIVLTGHSAGGHLAARMGGADAALPAGLAARIARIVPISPLADLRPLIETEMNAVLRLDRAEAIAESPAIVAPRRGLAARVWVGAAERPAFLDQARRLGNAWACPVTRDPGRHHFDVIEALARADSPLVAALLDGAG